MKIICIGRNYSEHIKELSNAVPEDPIFFLKPASALVRGNKPFFHPTFSNDIHHEVELVFRVSRLGKSIDPRFALSYIDAIGIGIDFTARDLQAQCKAKGTPWEIAKGFDGSAPVSNFLPLTLFPDIENISFRLEKNGQTVQQGNSADMIFKLPQIISYVSRFMTLRTGDLIFTGTPSGVGAVKPGDTLLAWLEDQPLLKVPVK
jgi:acylpyruvate hydrolase